MIAYLFVVFFSLQVTRRWRLLYVTW